MRKDTEFGYLYVVKDGYEDIPAIGITWNSAVRYINWLHYNSKNIESGVKYEDFIPYTEGTDSTGAYNTQLIDFKRNKDAIYWLPNEDEWNKACYYDGTIWTESIDDEGINCFDNAKGWKYPYPHIVSNNNNIVKPSHYGTINQLGNLAEWIENSMGSNWRKALGGSLIRPKSLTRLGQYEGDYPDKSIASFGLRVCRSSDKTTRVNGASINYLSTGINENSKSRTTVNDSNSGTYVLVDKEGNEGDYANQFKGSVNYKYYISKYELTNREYCRFLNSVASKSDPYSLFNNNMSTSVCGGIDRFDEDGVLKYQVKDGWENRPVVYIGFYDLARYANWLHYGCPDTGESIEGTTEGTKSVGAYDTSDFELVRSGGKAPYKNFGKRNEGALYWIPNEDEWYKAAYYDPTITGNRKYYDYPTRSSNPPLPTHANYMANNQLSEGEPYFVADVDKFAEAASYFGTQQQGGNVWEWIESWQYGVVGIRGLKGGSWSYSDYGLNAINTDPGGINDISHVFGGRLCKSFDSEGWKPQQNNLLSKARHSLVQISEKRFIILISALVLLIVGLVSTIIILTFKLKSSRNAINR